MIYENVHDVAKSACGGFHIVCHLSNFKFAFVNSPDGWKNLKEYCSTNTVKINKIEGKLRSHCEKLADSNAIAYSLKFAAVGILAGDSTTFQLLKVGKIEDGKILYNRWKIPEIEQMGTEERSPDDEIDSII